MQISNRRQFLRRLSALLGGVTAAGCGGGGAQTSAAAPTQNTLTQETAAASPPLAKLAADPAPSLLAPMSEGAMQFFLSSPSASTLAPFCLGYAFRKGDVPVGQGVVASLSTLQVTPKNRWPDGSLKFAVIAGRASLVANSPLKVTLSPGSAQPGSALTLQDLMATHITASVDCGTFGSVTWSQSDWGSPIQAWISGPEMSSARSSAKAMMAERGRSSWWQA